ncbi:MAG TPA: hypothetical protein VJO52_05390 [Gemmatimonadaceae bacterium]|nr:hypothetical protein [Gemmatimonadaceae bacterium]
MTLLTLASIATAALAFGPRVAPAQGYPGGGGGGMGGMGSMGGGGRRGGFGGNHGQHHQKMSEDDMQKRFENTAALKPALKDIGLDNAQKDTLDKLEKAYRPQLGDYGRALWSLAQNGGADPDSVKALRTGARTLRDQEYAEARGLLTTDQQPKFDQNVAKIHSDEAKRDDQMRSRMGVDDGP